MKLKPILSAIALPLLWILSITLFSVLPFSPLGKSKWFIMGIICSLLAWGLTHLFLKYDGISFSQIGLKWQSDTLKKFFVGGVLGIGVAVVMLGIILLFSDLTIEQNTIAFNPLAMFWLLLFIPLSFMEELAFRGYAFIKLNKIIGLRPTLIITSILFAYYHDATGATFMTQLLGPGIWGILYGITAIWSDGIALPTGLHAAVNMVMAFFGMKPDKYQHAIWEIDFPIAEVTDTMLAHTEMVGLIVQFLLLAFGIFLTELYLRKQKNSVF